MAQNKKFALRGDQIKPLAKNRGACFATDMITVEGRKVGYMYREEADEDGDSGWRFMSGHESQDYMDDPDNHGLYDVNTIANYDPQIIPLLDAPCGCAFEREGGSGRSCRSMANLGSPATNRPGQRSGGRRQDSRWSRAVTS
jgi:hypothetical protein